MGFYSSSQFLGTILVGMLGGILQGMYGLHVIFLFAALAALVWWLLAAAMTPPAKLGSYLYKTGDITSADAEQLTRQLGGLAGVAEVVVVAEEGVAYLKVDKQVFDESQLP
jgi:MFS family permease